MVSAEDHVGREHDLRRHSASSGFPMARRSPLPRHRATEMRHSESGVASCELARLLDEPANELRFGAVAIVIEQLLQLAGATEIESAERIAR